jgi:hypothetical protein
MQEVIEMPTKKTTKKTTKKRTPKSKAPTLDERVAKLEMTVASLVVATERHGDVVLPPTPEEPAAT